MLGIKTLHFYLLKKFIPVFAMTFGICLFIVLMQFLWKYVEDLVGKGLDTMVLAELFFYAALNLIPLALPLALLLASLMTFGNMGENLELLATKAAGVSLIRTMRPLIVLIALISIGAFFFQNDAMPKINVKFWTLLRSVKQKSPELDIPEGAFYNEIDNYNLYVKSKNKETKMLRGVMIYDTSKGFDNMAVIVCDSAEMKTSESKDYLLLTLYQGQQFANFNQSGGRATARDKDKFVPYSRENFKKKDIIIEFDANFNRLDESMLQGSQVSKNIYELKTSIDSLHQQIDSLNVDDRKFILDRAYIPHRTNRENDDDKPQEEMAETTKKTANTENGRVIDIDSLFATFGTSEKLTIYKNATDQSSNNDMDLRMRAQPKLMAQKSLRQHMTEFHRKFTLSFACLVFFFIGAPLGAIIRKGGLGMPVVISVILFIIYYIIDNVGYKMARDGVWEAWQGVWLSSFILFPLGIFLTYKANNDSALFNPEAYGKFIRKIFQIRKPVVVDVKDNKEIVHIDIPLLSDLHIDQGLKETLLGLNNDRLLDVVMNYESYGYDPVSRTAALSILKSRDFDLDSLFNESNKLPGMYFDTFCLSSNWTCIGYAVALLSLALLFIKELSGISAFLDASYFVLFIRTMILYFDFYNSIGKKRKIYHYGIILASFVCYPVAYLFIRKQMKKDLDALKPIEVVTI